MDLTAVKTAGSTPASSPGLFSPTTTPATPSQIPSRHGTPRSSPFLHPLQLHKVKETHKVVVDQDLATGRKLINQYEFVEEIGRGQHGKVKLARNIETGVLVAIKIIQRFSKKRRLGKLTYDPESKTKKEVAILKKVRHTNVVALLEVIDDPELKKIYLVLEHVVLGEIVWRKKGHGQVCLFEKRRLDKEMTGEPSTEEEEKFLAIQERRRKRKEAQRAQGNQLHQPQNWSLEHNQDVDDQDGAPLSRQGTHDSSQRSLAGSYPYAARSNPVSRGHSRTTSRAPSGQNSRSHTPLPEYDIPSLDSDNEDETRYQHQGWSTNNGPSSHSSSGQFAPGQLGLGQYAGSYPEDAPFRGRSPSMADSIISHMSSVGDYSNEPLEEDYSYVPCLTLEGARSIFRDTVLGLEYLHYEGIVHRDIKPANLLWTQDHRTKISDFGVSYFGRPIREGEPEEYVSEADAVDFDDDLELAKTVGTPAFFAPELCYTNVDMAPPKVTEQIDVWSLGVTLFALIYSRLPFMSDDEYSLWSMIATHDVFISRKRLMAVGPPSASEMDPHQSLGPYREEGELAFEEVDDELADLLRRMLIKDPLDRIKLREVKRHPWVIKGIDNVLGWIDDTDPSRKTSGKRIIVDKAELDHAVVPITLLDRARSVFIKTVNSIGGSMRRPKSDSGSRRRAGSSVNSSDNIYSPVTPIVRDSLSRRASLRGDEGLAYGSSSDLPEHRITTEHPLASGQTASSAVSSNGDDFLLDTVGPTQKRAISGQESEFDSRPGAPERAVSAATSIQTVVYRGNSYARSVTSTISNEDAPIIPGPFTDHHGNVFGGYLWRGRENMADIQETSPFHPKPVEYGVFTSENKRSEPIVALTNAVVPGHVENPPPSPAQRPRHSRPSELSPIVSTFDQPLESPYFFQSYMIHQHQSGQSNSTPNVPQVRSAASNLDQRPATANRSSEATKRTHQEFPKENMQDGVGTRRRAASNLRMDLRGPLQSTTNGPHSPHYTEHSQKQDPSTRAQSSSSINSTELISQLTSPSDIISPTSSATVSSQEQNFRSAPSLPGLVSSGSSVCADPEGDFLQHPGIVSPQSGFSHPDSTPEALSPRMTKNQGETPTQTTDGDFLDTLPADDEGYNGDGDGSDETTLTLEDDDSSDSDEGLMLMMGKKRKAPTRQPTLQRRGTNNSAGSTETAKKVTMEN